MRIILLPGLDGTAKLFHRFIAAAPPGADVRPISLPMEDLTYDELAEQISRELSDGPIVVIAESFSGPIAIALAERHVVTALVLCNSFVVAPRTRLLRWLILPIVFKLRPPSFMLRRFMVGPNADDALVNDVARTVSSVPANVLSSRLKAVLTVDKMESFASSRVPTLYLRAMEDRLLPESACQRMAAARPITIARVPGPHLLLQANAKGAWDAILRFLDSLPTDER